ncbi:unnamed protein product, partial [Phaeothamnion confervicola]
MYRIMPAIWAQAAVIYALFHVYAYIGILAFAGIESNADFGDAEMAYQPYYYLINFNSYGRAMVTLFCLLVVNNWYIIAAGYAEFSPLGRWCYLYFLSFQIVGVMVALNVLTAIFINAFNAKAARAQKQK